jgi:hypothetical protein
MPLTKKGREKLKEFKTLYGNSLGKNYFYAYMKKYPKKTKLWHKITS